MCMSSLMAWSLVDSLWSSGPSSWLLVLRSCIRFPAQPNFLGSSGPGKGSTQPREDNWGATWKKSSGSGLENWDWRTCGIRCTDHTTPFYPQLASFKIISEDHSPPPPSSKKAYSVGPNCKLMIHVLNTTLLNTGFNWTHKVIKQS
jgi:hypothetical protein